MNARMWLMTVAGGVVIRALGLTYRFSFHGREHLEAARATGINVIYASWHGRTLPLAYVHRNQSVHMLTSEHRDGELIGQTLRRLGFGHLRGSSTRGGSRAIREMAATVRSGYDVGITVDGPVGPRYRVKAGSVNVAKITGATIVPLSSGSKRHKVFGSWDGFQLPLPFTRVHIAYGPPITVAADADADELEARRIELERALRELTEETDRREA